MNKDKLIKKLREEVSGGIKGTEMKCWQCGYVTFWKGCYKNYKGKCPNCGHDTFVGGDIWK